MTKQTNQTKREVVCRTGREMVVVKETTQGRTEWRMMWATEVEKGN